MLYYVLHVNFIIDTVNMKIIFLRRLNFVIITNFVGMSFSPICVYVHLVINYKKRHMELFATKGFVVARLGRHSEVHRVGHASRRRRALTASSLH